MTLVRLNNHYGDMDYNNHISHLMETWLGNSAEKNAFGFTPATNVIEKEKSFILELAIPGYEKRDVNIKIENNLLTISHESKSEDQDVASRFIRKEFGRKSFSRSFRLSRWVDHENIQASFKNGILEIEMPKKEEAIAKPAREIKIN